jgi:hypothetical protein
MLVSHPDDEEPLRLLSSKQNETEKGFGDLKKTELLMDEDTFELSLGRKFRDIVAEAKKDVKDALAQRVQKFVLSNPQCTMPDVKAAVGAREQSVREILSDTKLYTRQGKGTKNRPHTFSLAESFRESLKMVGVMPESEVRP